MEVAPVESMPAARPSVHPPVAPLVRRVLLMAAAIFTSLNVDPVIPSIEIGARWLAGGLQRADAIALFGMTSLAVHALALVLSGVVAISVLRYVRARGRMPGAPVALWVDGEGLHAGDRRVLARDELASLEVTADLEGFVVAVTRHDGLVLRAPLGSERDAQALASALSPGHDPSALVFEGLADARTRETRAALVASAVIATLAAVHLIAVPYLTTGWIRQLAPAPFRWGTHPELLQYWLLWLQRFSTLPVGALSILAVGPVVRRLSPGRVRVDSKGLCLGWKGRDIGWQEVAGLEAIADQASALVLVLRDGERVRLALAPGRPEAERDAFLGRVRDVRVPITAQPRVDPEPDLRPGLVDPGA